MGVEQVRAMVRIADTAWTDDGVHEALAASGWLPEGRRIDRGPGGGLEFGGTLDIGNDRELELGSAPPGPRAFVAMPFALLWPPINADDTDDTDDTDDDGDEDDLDGEYPDVWERRPDAGPAEFEAEFLRVRALLEDLVGPPSHVHGSVASGVRWDVWERGDTVLTLYAQDDIPSYSHYDRLALAVWTADGWTPPE
ncbi:hypothetical protein EBO15_15520 [Actinomadura harenae]|uniref:Uncharacterized protein n=1 Tax=Actinomadura harenae TaxID=2483351 RepID=A0A3M2M593_9ACTN|nr:hypothetical protein EBO15_15520 [Actinomadura harenae]